LKKETQKKKKLTNVETDAFDMNVEKYFSFLFCRCFGFAALNSPFIAAREIFING
jgi:hypothetical protein